MHTVFVPRDLSRFVLAYCANAYFKLEQEAIGAQSVVVCRDFQDVIKYIERGPELDNSDSIDVVGIVPTAADMEVLRSMANTDSISVILGENQITPDIEKDEALVDNMEVPVLSRAWLFYMGSDSPNFIQKMELALANGSCQDDEISVLQDALAKLATVKMEVAMELIEEAVETDGKSLIAFAKGSV